MLDENVKAFVVHVILLISKMSIYLAQDAWIALLIAKEVIVPAEYLDLADVFSKELAKMLPKDTGIIEHAIELKDDKQPPYGPIYSLGPVKLETLKIYIENNLANGFIWTLKSPAIASILFVCKPNGSLRLCIDYQGLNNLTIKNRYLLALIGESLDRLRQAKRFTYLHLTSAYHWIKIKEGNE